MSRNQVLWVLLVISFMGSCAALLRPAARLADPMTHRPFRPGDEMRFPILIISNGRSTVHFLDPPYSSPTLKAGESFLVPEGGDREIERQLATSQRRGTEGGWAAEVKNISLGKQEIQLYWVNDGYSGGVYEATSGSVRPLYRKSTGPGFAFVFGGIAFGINVVVWSVGAFLVWRFRGQNRA